ncbi:MAG: Ig-like domain-containing protein [Candidatus Methanoperedens sp.]|nr:Ig-like domain-containing protein [Candidatus Methanoperedens sp.]
MRANILHKRSLGIGTVAILLIILNATMALAVDPGTIPADMASAPVPDYSTLSINPVITETGKISLSVDGLGTIASTGVIQAEKPAGATVRKAYMAAASMGTSYRVLANGDVKIDGADVIWDTAKTTPCSPVAGLRCSNHWADVTSIVKSKIDAAPAGRVDFAITEVGTSGIDGEILAVIFDDPSQTNDNTVVLLFGAQSVTGDNFAIALANPINKADPNLKLDMSLGISFGYQPSSQDSQVDVNGIRMTSSAGGQDDGAGANGALLTVGGLDDSDANPPNPLARGDQFSCPRCDDELYNLLPFVNNGDTSINVNTKNPSGDDNVFFAALNLRSTTAVVGEGILLAPLASVNFVGEHHTVTATVQDANGNPIVGRDVTFTIISGPHAGQTGTAATDASGKATFTYTGTSVGTDVIEASFVNSQKQTITSNRVTKEWKPQQNNIPEFPSIVLPVAGALGIMLLFYRGRER